MPAPDTEALPSHDVVVVGAGPVGAALALALADADLDVAVLDARPPGDSLRGDIPTGVAWLARLPAGLEGQDGGRRSLPAAPHFLPRLQHQREQGRRVGREPQAPLGSRELHLQGAPVRRHHRAHAQGGVLSVGQAVTGLPGLHEGEGAG